MTRSKMRSDFPISALLAIRACSTRRWHFGFVGLLLGVVAVAGCQSKPQALVPVEGTVVQGGRPLAGVIVEFHPESGRMDLRSRSEPTDAAGHYRLHSLSGEDGAIAGAHRVCLFDARGMGHDLLSQLPQEMVNSQAGQKMAEELKSQGLLEPVNSPPRIPDSYSNNSKTPLRVEVRPAQPILNLDVKVN